MKIISIFFLLFNMRTSSSFSNSFLSNFRSSSLERTKNKNRNKDEIEINKTSSIASIENSTFSSNYLDDNHSQNLSEDNLHHSDHLLDFSNQQLNERVANHMRELRTVLYRIQARLFSRNVKGYSDELASLRNVLQESKHYESQNVLKKITEYETKLRREISDYNHMVKNPAYNELEEINLNFRDWSRVSNICFDLNSIVLSGHVAVKSPGTDQAVRAKLSSYGYRSAVAMVEAVLTTTVSISLLQRKINELLNEFMKYFANSKVIF